MTKANAKKSPEVGGAAKEPNLGMIQHIHDGVQDQVRFADAKAGFVAALNALLFGFIVSHAKILADAVGKPDAMGPAFGIVVLLLVMYVLATAGSVILVILSVMSRFGESAPQCHTFFGHIVARYGQNYQQYVDAVKAMDESRWLEEVGTQVVVVSAIAASKHRRVRWAAGLTMIAFILWMGAFVTMLFV